MAQGRESEPRAYKGPAQALDLACGGSCDRPESGLGTARGRRFSDAGWQVRRRASGRIGDRSSRAPGVRSMGVPANVTPSRRPRTEARGKCGIYLARAEWRF